MLSFRDRKALGPSLCLAIIIMVGLFAVWFLCWSLAEYAVRDFFPKPAFKHLVFTSEGEALVETYPAGTQGQVDPIYHTLDGKLVPDSDQLQFPDDYPRDLPLPDSKMRPINNWSIRMVSFPARNPLQTFWYLIHDLSADGSAYFVGYDYRTRQLVGYFGLRGYSASLPPEKDRFKISFALMQSGGWEAPYSSRAAMPNYGARKRDVVFLISDGALLKINLSAQTIETLPTSGKVISLGGFGHSSGEDDRVVVRLPDELLFLSRKGERLGSLPLEPTLRDKILVLREPISGEMIVESRPVDDRYAPHEITWFSSEGKVLRRAEVDIYQQPPAKPGDWVLLTVVPIPLLVTAMTPLDAYSDVQRGVAPDMTSAMFETIGQFGLPYLVLVLVSLALAAWVVRRHRNYEPHRAVAWASFVFFLGPLGLVAYLIHRPWPARKVCEHCGRTVPANRTQCLACASAFPPPELRGIEVFA